MGIMSQTKLAILWEKIYRSGLFREIRCDLGGTYWLEVGRVGPTVSLFVYPDPIAQSHP